MLYVVRLCTPSPRKKEAFLEVEFGLTDHTGWEEGILGTSGSTPMSLGEKATLFITPYVTHLLQGSSVTDAFLGTVITDMVLGEY